MLLCSYTKEDVRDALVYAMRVRRRVKEQLKKIGGMEFYDVHFSYIRKRRCSRRTKKRIVYLRISVLPVAINLT